MKKTEKDPAAKTETAQDESPVENRKEQNQNPAAENPDGEDPAGDKDPEQEEPSAGEESDTDEEEAAPAAAEPGDGEAASAAAQPDAEPPAGEAEEPPAPAEEQPAPPPAEGSETDRLKADLLQARSQLAAYAAGVAPEMVADAVTLATAEARAAGEVTEDAVAKAMENVLKRHPEWKADSAGGKKTGGFRLGADPDRTGRGSKKSAADKGSKKPWNKFNR